MARVSIITALYNHEKYVGQAIESVLAQTYGDWEHIIWDDGSSDGSLKVAERYAARDARVKVFAHPGGANRGQENTRNAALEKAVPADAVIVALEVWGKGLGSEEFARKLESWGSTGKGHVAFVIGGAEGIPTAISQRAQFHLSLSPMTLPHRLARVILFEQLYRAMTILRGEPYAREG